MNIEQQYFIAVGCYYDYENRSNLREILTDLIRINPQLVEWIEDLHLIFKATNNVILPFKLLVRHDGDDYNRKVFERLLKLKNPTIIDYFYYGVKTIYPKNYMDIFGEQYGNTIAYNTF
jgi:hypothetical protein